MFTDDTAFVPKESSWFGSYAPPGHHQWTSNDNQTILPMRQQPLYLNDTIGLRTLDERGDVEFITCEGAHMEMSELYWQSVLDPYVGGYSKQLKNDMNSLDQKVLSLL